MSSLSSSFKRLTEGRFICPIRYPEEFAALESTEAQAKADEWLGEIGYRLARLGEDGAFFMAHRVVTAEMRAQVLQDMRQVRNKLEPVVSFIETIRLAQHRVHPGDVFFESEISDAVRQSPLLERRLQEMRDITGARITDSSLDRVRRMLQLLQADGYIVETNASLKGYTFTGRVDYLYQLIGFIAANSPSMTDDGVVDQIDENSQQRLDDSSSTEAPAAGAASAEGAL
ncbi:hypothetical protein [Polaromonas sp.]|uniref:condensin complex protein MksE n=1 Tax=Polaromonas sp. TaxID=1869339 RepID=UPI00352B6541